MGQKEKTSKNFNQVSLGQSAKVMPLYAYIWLLLSGLIEELERYKIDSGKAKLKRDTEVRDLFNLHVWCFRRVPVGSIL